MEKLIGALLWLIIIPFCMGLFPIQIEKLVEKKGLSSRPMWALISGYILHFALFECLCVPFVLKERSFFEVEKIFTALCAVVALLGILLTLPQYRNRKKIEWKKPDALLFLWILFLGSVAFQIYQSFHLAYADGDDAYYIPVSTAANLGGGMYRIDPYTGLATTMDLRHGLAPFPIWVSFMATKCMVSAGVAAQTVLPLFLIPLTYCIYYEIGKILCKKYLPLFLLLVSLLQIFGNYSIYPASTFLLTRTRQGKAALCNLILPFVLLLLLRLGETLRKKEKEGVFLWTWMELAVLAGCLCSTMSAFLIPLNLIVFIFPLGIIGKRYDYLWKTALCCLPAGAFLILYLYMG